MQSAELDALTKKLGEPTRKPAKDGYSGCRSASALCATLAVNVTGKDRTWGGQRRPGGNPARSPKLAEKPLLGRHGEEIKQFGGRPRHERLRQDRHLADHLGGDVEHGPLPRRIGLGERPERLAGEIAVGFGD